ncbi:acetolactate synthase small subunit [Buchnera aphidicola]|uniref:acetolactate synthase small subunit n=1 Tax=Buchnera aphidicola TaxID=9 RepID=UPI002237166B|nr:acetolactate synthase small subunit [Buchnera aphidicola]MCW5197760.1 acetolactate synthase small subunit [Buchnera aphidicola (Chaitophorus viminalis)]
MKQTLSIIAENKSFVLSRIISLFSQRGYHIESMTMKPISNKKLFSIVISTQGNKQFIKQISKQLYKLINVLKVKKI